MPHRAMNHTRHMLGITLIESVLSLLIIGGAFVAALNTISGARASQAVVAERRMGLVLAQDMMEEILALPYKENALLGLELGENTGDRSRFDDIDDYNGWTSTPPCDASGSPIAGTEAYTREVTVRYVQLNNPALTSSTDQGVKRIIVTVKRGSKQVAELRVFRTDAWQSPQESY